MTQPRWKITFPISKAEKRADGVYLMGEASGPELDLHGERMSEECIQLFEQQVNDNAADLVALSLLDAHTQDGVLNELGSITRAWVNPDFHLGVELKLDMDNPAAVYLAKQIDKGKKFGLSIGGAIVRYVDEYVEALRQVVRTYNEITLTEISVTKRPAWTPSFGTVLSKSVDLARAADAEGESLLSDIDETELQRDETAAPDSSEAADESAKTCECPDGCEDCKGSECACSHEPAAESESEDAESASDEAEPAADDAEAEPAADAVENSATPVPTLKKDAWDAMSTASVIAQVIGLIDGEIREGDTADVAKLRQAIELLQGFLTSEIDDMIAEGAADAAEDAADGGADEATEVANSAALPDDIAKALEDHINAVLAKHGIAAPQEQASQTETTSEKTADEAPEGYVSKAQHESELSVLKKSLEEASARITELEETPSSAPALKSRDDGQESFETLLKQFENDPMTRMRLGFAALHNGK